jgi:DNA-binding CsgD family transcriptional regulator
MKMSKNHETSCVSFSLVRATANRKTTSRSEAIDRDGEPLLHTFLCDGAWGVLADRLALSTREAQIVGRIFADEKEAKIARTLGISPHTVRTHLERLYHKLNVQSRTELVLRVVGCLLAETGQPDSQLPPICGNRAAGRCPLDHRRTNSRLCRTSL